MVKFADLLQRTTAECNRKGLDVAIATLLFGIVHIAVGAAVFWTATSAVVSATQKALPPEAAQVVEQQVFAIRSQEDIQTMFVGIEQELEKKYPDATPEVRKTQAVDELATLMLSIGFTILPIALLSVFVVFAYWVFCLAMGTSADIGFVNIFLRSLFLLPGIFAVVMLVFAITFLWAAVLAGLAWLYMPSLSILIVVAGAITCLVFGPRFVLAPVFYAQENLSPVAAMRRSYEATRKQWLRVFSNLVGVVAVVWIAENIAQWLLGMLIQTVSAFSSYAFLLGQLMTFLLLIATAYRALFLITLKGAVVAHPRQ